ncbi:hypothetical protein Q671_04100 [Halomonas sp. PBN3]|nr:hypothetical protein Q671_04100 [Halomonas sp. PBN3]
MKLLALFLQTSMGCWYKKFFLLSSLSRLRSFITGMLLIINISICEDVAGREIFSMLITLRLGLEYSEDKSILFP